MQLENEYRRTNFDKYQQKDDDFSDNAHYSELKEAISELVSVYHANMEQRKQLINQATAAVEAKKYDRVSSNQKIRMFC